MHNTSREEAIEQQIADRQKAMEFRDRILKLIENPDFKYVIREKFMIEAAAAYVCESQDPTIPEANQKDALRMAQAAGHLKRFLNVSIQLGDRGQAEIEGLREMLADERADTEGNDNHNVREDD